MSQPDSPTGPALPPLGIIHLLGWITGVAVVLALYRLALDSGWLGVAQARVEETRWWQFGYGLVYGTALSTLGLLVYRRFQGDRRFPQHPGHWLLVCGGIAFLLDAGAFVVAKGIVVLWLARTGWDPGWYIFQQSLAWGVALIVAAAFLGRLQTGWNWRLLALLISALIAINWLTHTQCVIELATRQWGYPIFRGAWPYELAHCAHLSGVTICLASLPVVLRYDDRPRDWLHWVGVVATATLAAVELTSQIVGLIRPR